MLSGAAGLDSPHCSQIAAIGDAGLDAPHSSQIAASGGAGVRRALGRPAVRLVLLAALGFGGASWLQGQGTGVCCCWKRRCLLAERAGKRLFVLFDEGLPLGYKGREQEVFAVGKGEHKVCAATV
eukprot:32037-Pelagomonas_calceolata.AAC.3